MISGTQWACLNPTWSHVVKYEPVSLSYRAKPGETLAVMLDGPAQKELGGQRIAVPDDATALPWQEGEVTLIYRAVGVTGPIPGTGFEGAAPVVRHFMLAA